MYGFENYRGLGKMSNLVPYIKKIPAQGTRIPIDLSCGNLDHEFFTDEEHRPAHQRNHVQRGRLRNDCNVSIGH